MWWMQPGWKDACCVDCGCNIWDAGGDPDHGRCYECFSEAFEAQRKEAAGAAARKSGRRLARRGRPDSKVAAWNCRRRKR